MKGKSKESKRKIKRKWKENKKKWKENQKKVKGKLKESERKIKGKLSDPSPSNNILYNIQFLLAVIGIKHFYL